MNAPLHPFHTDLATEVPAAAFAPRPAFASRGKGKGRVGRVALVSALAGIGVLGMPAGQVELIVASIGLSEIIPAAAPPLGHAARLMLATGVSVLAAGVGLALSRSDEGRAENFKQGGTIAVPPEYPLVTDRIPGLNGGLKIMGFVSKLTAFARGDGRLTGKSNMNVLARRRADAHPDAPPRRPIFASEDFADLDFTPAKVTPIREATVAPATPPKPLDMGEIEKPVAVQPPAPPVEVAATPAEQPVIDRRLNVPPTPPMPLSPAPAPKVAAPLEQRPAPLKSASLDTLSVSALAARFERGLENRVAKAPVAEAPPAAVLPEAKPAATLAEMPAAQAAPVRSAVDDVVDQALRDALAALKARSPGR